MIKFIVLSTQRSGSLFVCTCLDSYPNVRCHNDLFMPKAYKNTAYRAYRQAPIQRRIEHLIRPQASVDRYLAGIFDDNIDALGFKLMYGQARRFPQVSHWCRKQNVGVIHLIRRNSLKIHVSRQIAKKRGIYFSTVDPKPMSVSLDTRSLVGSLRRIEHEISHYGAMFDVGDYMEIFYEDFVADPEKQSERLLSFLDVAADINLSSNLVKTSSDSLADVVDNYGEIQRVLGGTDFEKHL